jgi:CheY-like chemotaxis protein
MPENGKVKVLVAEDDRFLSSLLKAKLQKEGFEVKTVFDGEEAVQAVKEWPPDIILLDLIMPKVSGFEFLETVSIDPQYNRTPIIVLTNLGQDGDRERAKQLGVVEYFVKSQISIEEVIAAVRNFVSARTAAA